MPRWRLDDLLDMNARDHHGIVRRRATFDDLPIIAAIHRGAYSRSHFTSLLSASTLERYYAGFLAGGTQIALAQNNEGTGAQTLGFSVYGTGIPEKIAAFKQECARDILLTSLQHPWIAARKALKAIRGRIGRHAPVEPTDFLLLSIAVTGAQTGVGALLLRDLVAAARAENHDVVGLYVNDDNLSAINAYYRAGFRMRDFHNGQYYMEAAIGR